MAFYIVHELVALKHANDGRMRIRADGPVPAATMQDLCQQLENIDGIASVSASPRVGSLLIFYNTKAARTAALTLLAASERLPARQEPSAPAEEDDSPFLGGLLPLLRYIVVRPFMPPFWRMISAGLSAAPYLLQGLKTLLRGRLTVEVLDAAAIGASLYLRDFRTVSMLTLLLGLGDTLAYWTRRHSLDTLSESLTLNVRSVWLLDESGTEVAVPINEVRKDDLVVVRDGASIPVDGIVEDGVAVVNQSSMTGEPLGVKREKGGAVFAGTVVEEGRLVIRVTGVGDSTRFRQVATFIEESEALKAGIQGKYERLADMAVPFTFALAGIVWLTTRSFMRAAAVLMVDYSCALKLATPLAVLASMREGACNGVVIKGGRYLEALNEVDTVVFDKTGTLTNANPVVVEVIPAPGFERDEVLRTMACLEEHFPHPVARAVVNAALKENLKHEEQHAEVEYVVAHGVASSLHGKRVLVGSRHYVEYDEGVDLTPMVEHIKAQAARGRSLLYLACDGKIAGMLAIEDPLRSEAVDVISELRASGIKRILMLTGDDRRTAEAIAKSAGITEFRAEVLPMDKSSVVRDLTENGCKVLMVGDGINDAPALSASHVGVAMSDGTDLAQEVANVLLTRADLHGIVLACQLGRGTMRRIHTNFVLAMGLNSLFLLGGIFMILPAALSALLHNLTTLGISVNAMRPHLPPAASPETPRNGLAADNGSGRSCTCAGKNAEAM